MRFMTWNVENFFLPGAAFGVTDPALFEEKSATLAAVITNHEPDVIGLQEVGDPAALDRLKTKLAPKYPQALTATRFDTMHPIRTAALLHQGVQATDETEIMNFPPGFSRRCPPSVGTTQRDGARCPQLHRDDRRHGGARGGDASQIEAAHLPGRTVLTPTTRTNGHAPVATPCSAALPRPSRYVSSCTTTSKQTTAPRSSRGPLGP
jgi:hypothetical protein